MKEKKVNQRQVHEFAPVYNSASEILILGSFPSVKSREEHFYYGHPQNRFWKVLAALTKSPLPETISEKTELLLSNHIALWDVIASCEIIGSSDSSIRNVIPSDITGLLRNSNIKKLYANGLTAKKLYDKYVKADTGYEIEALPSTSPANAAYSLERLIADWSSRIFHCSMEKI